MNGNYTLEILKKYNIEPKKSLGQNFLIDQNILSRIVEISNIQGWDILEIGPGIGSLTNSLIPTSKTVQAFEVDHRAIEILKNELTSEKLEVINQDFLQFNPSWEGKKKIVANIPYYITSDIIFKILSDAKYYESATLMIQEEVADRIVAKEHDSNYGKLSVTIQALSIAKKQFQVKPSCFFPAPKVNSAIITLDLKSSVNDEDKNNFMEFIKLCFSQQRKTLVNNLKTKYDVSKINLFLTENNKPLTTRPQQLSVNEFLKLFNVVKL